MKYFLIVLLIIPIISSCGTAGRNGKVKREPKREVPITININTGKSHELNFINLDFYRFKVLDQLEDFQNVDFTLVEPGEDPEVILNLNIDNFILWPRNEQVSRRVLSRVVQTGSDASGKPIYQTVRASVDIIRVQRRSNARLLVDFKIKGTPGKTYKQSFAPNYNYDVVYVDNVQGDPRAVDPSIYFSRRPAFEPESLDFLLQLSAEMAHRVNRELRSYYGK